MVVRNNQLGFARRGALAKMAGQNVGAFTTVRHGTVDGPDGVARLMVSFEGETPVSVASLSGKYPVGGVVAVLVDSAGRPQHVLGAVESGLIDSETGEELTPEFVQVLPDLVPPAEISAEEKARLEGVEAGLAEAQQDLADARTEAEQNFEALDDKLGQAFPDDIFDVGAALGAVEVDVLAQAALDAQGMATEAQQAAITAAQDFAAGKISEAELRAATDAQAKADAARDAAIEAAETYADARKNEAIDAAALTAQTKADVAKQGAIEAAALDAQAKATAAASAAETAAKEHADLVAQGASQAAIDAAALDAQSKADVAKQAAIDAAKTDLANLQIGGRNYLLDSSELSAVGGEARGLSRYIGEDGHLVIVAEPDNSNHVSGLGLKQSAAHIGASLSEGDTVTFSMDVKSDDGTGLPSFYLGQGWGVGYIPATGTLGPEWSRVYVTTQVGSSEYSPHFGFSNRHGTYTVRRAKLERGSKATDWTPAPEDVDAGIADAQALAETADGKADTAQQVAATADGKATTAVTEAGTAKTNAATALSTANVADTKAGQAVTTAGQANTAAQNAVATASAASTTASNAQAVADDALSKYGPLDQRTINAQAAADAAASAASAAATAAGLAQARADSAHSQATAAGTAASAAMTTADGKNTTSYKTVTTTPGPAPTNNVEGQNRRQFDMHRNRLSNGTIVGEWMWSGTSWVQVHMGDGILRSLDVGKLTAGTANIETGVVNKLWGQLGVFDKLDVRTDAYVSGVNLKDGAVTSRTLNVVPEAGTGGLKLDAYGMDVVGPDTGEAATSVSLRADSANALQFAQAGNATFTVSPDGNVAAQSVAANHGFTYRGQELADLLAAFPAGVVAHSRMADGTLVHVGGTMSRLTHATFTLPENGGDRMLRFEARLGFGGTALGIVELRAQAGQAVFTTDSGGSTLIGRYYKPISPYTEYITLTAVRSASELGFQPGDTVSIGLMIASNYNDAVAGKYLTVHPSNGQELTVSDLGPAVEPQKPAPYLPAQASGATPAPTGTQSQSSTSTYTREFSPSWTRSFTGSGAFYNYATDRAYHGQYLSGNGVLGSMVGFNTTEIQAFIAGGEVTSASVYVENAFTYSSSGMTANWGLHSQSSAPASFTVPAGQWAATFKRGEGRWLGIPRTEYSKFKTGYAAGILLKPPTNSISSYGYFDGRATRLKITVRK